MLAAALGKDPLDAAVIAAITASASLGVLLASDESTTNPVEAQGDLTTSTTAQSGDASIGDNNHQASSDDNADGNGGDGD